MNDIITSKTDKREYKSVVLNNKLRCILISDPDTDMSYASLAVNVGHYKDPDNYEGLAHFLEHMLFMGSKKYPDENEYNVYLNKHGGYSNAYTDKELTNYYFSITPKYFNKCLDIFSRFFIDPLFKEDSVNREVNAVDSEHKKNINNDYWREDHLLSILTDRNHPNHKFGTGSLETLQKPNLRNELLKFHDKYYSANIMSLCLLSNHTMEELTNMISCFESITNKDISEDMMKDYKINPYRSLPKNLHLVSIQDYDKLQIMWILPNDKQHYDICPIEYISELLGTETKNSVCYELKNLKLCTMIQTYEQSRDDNTIILCLSLRLTELGKNNISSIINIIYHYIDILKNIDHERYYEDFRVINKINFDYLSKDNSTDYVTNITKNMFEYPIKFILSHGFILNSFNSYVNSIIRDYLNFFNRNNNIVLYSSNNVLDNHEYITNDKVYNLEYSNINIDTSLKLLSEDYKLSSPKYNQFIPNIDTLYLSHITKEPIEIYKNFWIKQDTKYNLPKVIFNLNMYNDNISKTHKSYISHKIIILLLEEYLNPVLYPSTSVGTNYDIYLNSSNIEISIECYTDIFMNIVLIITNAIKNIYCILKLPNIKDKFTMFKDLLTEEYENTKLDPPYSRLFPLLYTSATKYNTGTIDDKLKILHSITLEDCINTANDLRDNLYTKTLLQGCFNLNIIKPIIDIINDFIPNQKTCIYDPTINYDDYIMFNPKTIINNKSTNPSEINNGILCIYNVCNFNESYVKDWKYILCCVSVFESIAKEKFFNRLRTKEQLGYFVRCNKTLYGHTLYPCLGICFTIQSPVLKCHQLEEKIKSFIDDLQDIIKSYNNNEKDEFNDIITSLIKMYDKNDDNLYEEFSRNNQIINRNYHNFNFRTSIIDTLKKININDILIFYDKHIVSNDDVSIVNIESYNS